MSTSSRVDIFSTRRSGQFHLVAKIATVLYSTCTPDCAWRYPRQTQFQPLICVKVQTSIRQRRPRAQMVCPDECFWSTPNDEIAAFPKPAYGPRNSVQPLFAAVRGLLRDLRVRPPWPIQVQFGQAYPHSAIARNFSDLPALPSNFSRDRSMRRPTPINVELCRNKARNKFL